jgi:hypothetical protein
MKLVPVLLVLLAACATAAPRQAATPAPRPQEPPAPTPVLALDGQRTEPDAVALAKARWPEKMDGVHPHVKHARSTYPAAKQRFLTGLPEKQTFYITAFLSDDAKDLEQVFVLVDRIDAGTITGQVASEIHALVGVHAGDTVQVPESEVLDWTILRADGSEAGNGALDSPVATP